MLATVTDLLRLLRARCCTSFVAAVSRQWFTCMSSSTARQSDPVGQLASTSTNRANAATSSTRSRCMALGALRRGCRRVSSSVHDPGGGGGQQWISHSYGTIHSVM